MTDPTYVTKIKQHQARLLPSRISELDIELTERCNNACIHCLINRPENDAGAIAGEMSTPFVKNILQQAADLGCLSVRLTGGEPLLRADFKELYLFARRLGMYVILFTNARLITPEIAQLLAQYPPGHVVEVTVYGMHAESYDAVAASRGAFAEFWRGVEYLKEYDIPFIVKQSVLPPNRAEMAEFEAFAATLPRMESLPGYTMNFDLRARRDNPAKNRLIEALRLSPEETVKMLSRDPNYLKSMREFAGKFMGPPGDALFACGAGFGACVDAFGKAQMCLSLRHPDMVYDLSPQSLSPSGKMGQEPGSLHHALTEVFPRWRKVRATNPDYLNRCAICFIKGICEQCPAKSWAEHGTLDTPVEYVCQVAHAQARYLGLVAENENAWELERDVWRNRLAGFINAEEPRQHSTGERK
jgi:MoaA/NifB/PqqE/SkfB family radical SAM enzyme